MTSFNADKIIDCFGGDGAAIILVHGFGADRYSWLGNAPELVKHGKVYTIELPGHGNAWDIPAAQGLQQLYDEILGPAIDQIAATNGSSVHLVGHSLGGALAIMAAAHNTKRTASLSLIAPLGLGSGANQDFVKKYPELDDESETLEVLQRTVFNPRLISSQLLSPLLTHLRRDGVRGRLTSLAGDILRPAAELTRAVDQVAASHVARQVIWGLNDNINSLVGDDETRFGGQWHKLDNCGHLPHVEQRVQVNQLLTDMVHASDV